LERYLGIHLITEFINCKSDLSNLSFIERIMKEAAIEAKATIVESVFHVFSPYGISGVVVISESHLAIHTWPEFKHASIDVFTCGDTCNPKLAIKYLELLLKPQRVDIKEIYRYTEDSSI
jgi:S-adenosylmethionine decarboxylase